jgi:hypothetical protein
LVDNPVKVIARTKEPILQPQEHYERVGDVNNVVFPTAAASLVLFVRKEVVEDKIEILTELLKPAEVETIFGNLKPVKWNDERCKCYRN